jgi:hypothetical protein
MNGSRVNFSAREIAEALGLDVAARATEDESAMEALDFEMEPAGGDLETPATGMQSGIARQGLPETT